MMDNLPTPDQLRALADILEKGAALPIRKRKQPAKKKTKKNDDFSAIAKQIVRKKMF